MVLVGRVAHHAVLVGHGSSPLRGSTIAHVAVLGDPAVGVQAPGPHAPRPPRARRPPVRLMVAPEAERGRRTLPPVVARSPDTLDRVIPPKRQRGILTPEPGHLVRPRPSIVRW